MPSDKRARQRAGREARMAELRRAQQRRRSLKRGGVIGAAVVIALVLAVLTGTNVFGGGSSKAKTTTKPASQVTTAQLTPLAKAALNTVTPPPSDPACTAPPATGTAPPTIPAKGNAVAIISAPGPEPFPALDGSAPHFTKFTAAPPFCIDVTKTYTATLNTDLGPITIQLLPANAPLTVNNFVYLAGYHFFDGTIFHRVVVGFVDQGGDPLGSGSGNPGYKFADELPKSPAAYDAGAVAMANSGPDTNGSQFFLVVGNGGQQLTPANYSMYGQVTGGINLVNEINADGSAGSAGTPVKVHRIESVTIAVSSAPAPPTTTSTTTPGTTTPGTTSPATTTPATTAPASTSASTAPPST